METKQDGKGCTCNDDGGLKPGDRVLWTSGNGTQRTGVIVEWFDPTGTWFVAIDPRRDMPNGDGFRTWFKARDLVKVET